MESSANTLTFWSPFTFSILVAAATLLLWRALAPARTRGSIDDRLDDYLEGSDVVEHAEMARPFTARVLMPMLHRFLRVLGAFMPQRNLARIEQQLIYAGQPGHLSALDFLGLRFLCALALVSAYQFLWGRDLSFVENVRNGAIIGVVGYFLPWLWLRSKARKRQRQIQRALPDALDMLTVGVEAGLAFESAMLRVGEHWENPLTDEFRRAVGEMRLGASRNEALQHMIDRTNVEELTTFVAVLIQSSQLGVSIAHVLHAQSAQMREIRRQRAEETARQAAVKIVVVMVFFIFPVVFIVMLGPAIPQVLDFMNNSVRTAN